MFLFSKSLLLAGNDSDEPRRVRWNGLQIPQRTSWSDENPGRRFWLCLPSQFQDEEDKLKGMIYATLSWMMML